MEQNLQPSGSRDIQDANVNTEGRTVFKSLLHFQGNFNIFHRMYRQKELCDVSLLVDDIEIPAHKMVLAASSLYFYMMFSKIGGKQNDDYQILMQQINSRTLLLLVDYMYTAIICITEENVRDLLAAANLLVLSEVQDACCNFLKNQLSPSNCLGISNIAQHFNYLDLKTHADTYIEHHFLEVVKHDEFLALTHKQLPMILSRDKLTVHSEENVFESVLAWVRHDQERRHRYLYSLMEYVRLPLLSPKYLLEQLDEPLLKGNLLYTQFIVEAFKYQFLEGDTKTPLHTVKIIPRQKVRPPKCLVAFGKANDSLSLEIYDFKEKKWMDGPKTIERKWIENSATAICRGKFYVIEGESNKVHVYDPLHEVWSSCDGMFSETFNSTTSYGNDSQSGKCLNPIFSATSSSSAGSKKGYQFGASVLFYNPAVQGSSSSCDGILSESSNSITVLGDFIYAAAGYDRRTRTHRNTAQMYDSQSGKWIKIASMARSKSCLSLGTMNEKIYAVGGRDGQGIYSTVECYDPKKNTWSQLPSMLSSKINPGVAALDGKLYAVGGSDNQGLSLKSAETFNPAICSWTRIADMHVCRSSPGVVAMDGLLYVIGGFISAFLKRLEHNSVEVYDPKANTWTLLPNQMKTGKEYVYATVMDWPVNK